MMDRCCLLRECPGVTPVKCSVSKNNVCRLRWGPKLRQKLVVKFLFGTPVVNPSVNHLNDKEQFLWGQQCLGANSSQASFNLQGFGRDSRCLWASVSCSVKWGCQSPHQKIAVTIRWNDEGRLPWDAQLMFTRNWVNAVFDLGGTCRVIWNSAQTYLSTFIPPPFTKNHPPLSLPIQLP